MPKWHHSGASAPYLHILVAMINVPNVITLARLALVPVIAWLLWQGKYGPALVVFLAAAVSDFSFGKIWLRSSRGELTEVKAGKISTAQGTLLAELVPTPKIITELRALYPTAKLVGWKYEVDGDHAGVMLSAQQQLAKCLTDACVANGPAYGEGFGIVTDGGRCDHFRETPALFDALEKLLRA